MESQTASTPSLGVKPNGSASGGTMTANPVASHNSPTSPSNISPTSPAFRSSPKALPPILPAHVPKDVSLSSGLLSRKRSASPLVKPPLEGVSQNPAAILKTGALGMSSISDGPPLTSVAPTATQESLTQLAPMENAAKLNNATSTGQAPQVEPASAGETTQEPLLTSPKSATSVASLDPSLTATSGIGSETSPTRTRTGSVSDSAPAFLPQGATHGPAPPFSPTAPPGSINDHRASVSSTTGEQRGSTSSVGGGRGKHTCPHCSQTFTRHHNLKSHLLTHSQEKPFQCTTCTSRFRRLHDLKRHQKLHTGERPHVCSSCGRRFARGDALARHARGEGGCAGRRSSMSALGEEAYEGDGDHMEGLEMSGDVDDEMPDYDGPPQTSGEGTPGRRTASLPSLRTRNMSASHQGGQSARGNQGFQVPPPPPLHLQQQQQQHHTYPPGGHPPLVQAGVPFGQASSKASGAVSASTTSIGSSSVTAGSSVPSTILSSDLTASPRPLSPNNHQQQPPQSSSEAQPSSVATRTQSVSSFHQQAVENHRRSNTGTLPPPAIGLPQPGQLPQIGPHPGQTSPQSGRGSRSSFSNSLPSPMAGGIGGQQQQSGQGNIFSSGEQGIWAYIQNLEKRIQDLEEKNASMEIRLAALGAERHNNVPTETEKK